MPDEEGDRACNGGVDILNRDPLFKDYVPFYEYFDGDSGRGLGASHQTGWTSLVTKWIHDNASNRVQGLHKLQRIEEDNQFSCMPVKRPTMTMRKNYRNMFLNVVQCLVLWLEESQVNHC